MLEEDEFSDGELDEENEMVPQLLYTPGTPGVIY